MRPSLSWLSLAALLAAPVLVATAALAAAPVPPPLARQPRPVRFQSVVNIEAASVRAEPVYLESGQLISVQTVRPAHGVRLTSAPRRDVYGVVGSVLWQARDAQGDLWCWRNTADLARLGNFYCYRDTNNDGVFDALYESAYPSGDSLFQTFSLGRDEKIKTPVSYTPADPPDFSEIVALRYRGVESGLIDANDHILIGAVVFELVVGRDIHHLKVVQSWRFDIGEGRGSGALGGGQALLIDWVEVGGRTRVRLLRNLPGGEGVVLR